MYLISLASSEDGMLVSTGELTLSFSGEVVSWLSFGSAPHQLLAFSFKIWYSRLWASCCS
jgi:hypothetical protein